MKLNSLAIIRNQIAHEVNDMQNFFNEHVLKLEMRTVQMMEIWEERILHLCWWDVQKPRLDS